MQGPATLTQEIAWVGMLVSYTRERGLKQGVAETFDGKHPCRLCCMAKRLREEKPREHPGDSDSRERRLRQMWPDMLPVALIGLPRVRAKDLVVETPAGGGVADGRNMDAPEPPPPRPVARPCFC